MTVTSTGDKYVKQFLVQHAKDLKELERFVAKLPTLDGYTGEWVADSFFCGGTHQSKNYILSNTATEINSVFYPGGNGSTSFKIADGGPSTVPALSLASIGNLGTTRTLRR